jgi:hypothetical protein
MLYDVYEGRWAAGKVVFYVVKVVLKLVLHLIKVKLSFGGTYRLHLQGTGESIWGCESFM